MPITEVTLAWIIAFSLTFGSSLYIQRFPHKIDSLGLKNCQIIITYRGINNKINKAIFIPPNNLLLFKLYTVKQDKKIHYREFFKIAGGVHTNTRYVFINAAV